MQRLFSWGVWVNCSAVTPWSSLISTTTMSWMWFASKKVLWINFTRLQFFKEVWMLVLDKSSSRTRWSRTEVPFALVWKFDLTWVPRSSACFTLCFENDRVILWLFFNFSFVRRTPHFVFAPGGKVHGEIRYFTFCERRRAIISPRVRNKYLMRTFSFLPISKTMTDIHIL